MDNILSLSTCVKQKLYTINMQTTIILNSILILSTSLFSGADVLMKRNLPEVVWKTEPRWVVSAGALQKDSRCLHKNLSGSFSWASSLELPRSCFNTQWPMDRPPAPHIRGEGGGKIAARVTIWIHGRASARQRDGGIWLEERGTTPTWRAKNREYSSAASFTRSFTSTVTTYDLPMLLDISLGDQCIT